MDESVMVGYPDSNREGGFGKVVTISATALQDHLDRGFVQVETDKDGAVKALPAEKTPAPKPAGGGDA